MQTARARERNRSGCRSSGPRTWAETVVRSIHRAWPARRPSHPPHSPRSAPRPRTGTGATARNAVRGHWGQRILGSVHTGRLVPVRRLDDRLVGLLIAPLAELVLIDVVRPDATLRQATTDGRLARSRDPGDPYQRHGRILAACCDRPRDWLQRRLSGAPQHHPRRLCCLSQSRPIDGSGAGDASVSDRPD
jgi:hypothetical protein